MKTYAIHWKSTLTGMIGIGTILFEKQAAERLVTELNEQYPDIDHEVGLPAAPVAEPAGVQPTQP